MLKTLKVRHTYTHEGKPLAVLDLPGQGAEMTPTQMRDLAMALQVAAGACEDIDRAGWRYVLRQIREGERPAMGLRHTNGVVTTEHRLWAMAQAAGASRRWDVPGQTGPVSSSGDSSSSSSEDDDSGVCPE